MATAITTDDRVTVERYFQLVDEGVIAEDDHVELLDGVIVAVPPCGPRHATGLSCAARILVLAIADRAVVRVQLPLVAGRIAAPEPDIAVVAGTIRDYRDAHPQTALLVIEVAESSLVQDRLTKARIYAGADVPEFWIVNLRDDCVEVLSSPDPEARCYRDRRIARRGESLPLTSLAGIAVAVDDLLPPPH